MNKSVIILLNNLKLGVKYKKPNFKSPYNKVAIKLLILLYKLGYIKKYTLYKNKYIITELNFNLEQNIPILKNIQLVSTPGRKIYCRLEELKNSINNFETIILSTTSGFMLADQAFNKKLGGEIICKIF